MRTLRRSMTFAEDPVVAEYLGAIGQRIVAASDAAGQAFSFFVVDDPTINAFAGPGGHIGVNAGLILATDTESELAAVLAHEVAHVSQHHLARTAEMSSQLSIPTLAAMLAAAVLASQGGGQAGQAALATVMAGSTQLQLDFIRGNEQEADRVGIQALERSGFDPRAMPGFFERLQAASRYDVGTLPEFLRTHPVTESRIADARNRAEQRSYRQYQDSLGYHLARVRLKIRTLRNPHQAVTELGQALKNGQYRNPAAAHYGYALALLAARDYSQAKTEIDRLLVADPERIPYLVTRADIELAAGHSEAAIKIYHDGLRLYPGNSSLTISAAQALLQTGRSREARDQLRSYVKEHPGDPALYKLLARAEGEAGGNTAAREAVAEYLYLTGETRGAIAELRKAIADSQLDFYTGSRLDARLKELEEEWEREKAKRSNRTPLTDVTSPLPPGYSPAVWLRS